MRAKNTEISRFHRGCFGAVFMYYFLNHDAKPNISSMNFFLSYSQVRFNDTFAVVLLCITAACWYFVRDFGTHTRFISENEYCKEE